ncbi:MAG: VCBS repeat-containing protein [Planctomycetes bacterium]|nr:VCBS repeat-containing protein [Planctomycetota bacterium]
MSRLPLAFPAALALALATRAAAQYSEPLLVFEADAGRPSAGQVEEDGPGPLPPPGDDLDLSPVVVVPKKGPSGGTAYTIIEVPGGNPIVVPLSVFYTGLLPGHSTSGLDMDGDLSEDFVTANDDGTVTLMLGDDDQGAVNVAGPGGTVSVPGGEGLRRVVAAQLDGLLGKDLVVASDDAVWVLLANHAGGFDAPASPAITLAPGQELQDLALGDVDGDLDLDLAVATGQDAAAATSGAVAIHPWTGLGFQAAPSQSFAAIPGQAVASVLLGDLNGDAFADALVTTHEFVSASVQRGYVRVYVNTGAGFPPGAPPAGFSFMVPSSIGAVPTFGALGDVDGDLDLDALFTTNDSVAYPPGSFAQFTPPIVLVHVTNALAPTGGGVAFTKIATRFSGKALDPILVDFDDQPPPGPAPPGDGTNTDADTDLDLVLAFTVDKGAGTPVSDEGGVVTYIAALLNAGGSFAELPPDPVPGDDAPGDGDTGQLDDLAIDGGALDFVEPNDTADTLTIALGAGDGSFPTTFNLPGVAPPAPFGYAGGPQSVRLAAFDANGHLDGVVYSQFAAAGDVDGGLTLLSGDGWGELLSTDKLSLAHGGAMAPGDFDGDGNADVVVTQHLGAAAPQTIEVHAGDGTVHFAAGGTKSFTPDPDVILLGGLDLADVDGDLDLDAVTTYLQGATGGPAPPRGAAPPPVPLNKVGLLLLRGDGAGGGAIELQPWFTAVAPPPDVESLALGDISGDGELDVAVGLRTGELWYATGDGTGAFMLQVIDAESADTGGGSLALGDVDCDGRLDIVSCKGEAAGQAVVQVHFSGGGNDFEVREIGGWGPADDDGGTRPLLLDADGDGALDLGVAHPNGKVTLLLSELQSLALGNGGKAGSGGITPVLGGEGCTTPGGLFTLRLTQGLGGAWGALVVGSPPDPAGWLDFTGIWLTLPVALGGSGPGNGTWEISVHMPKDPLLLDPLNPLNPLAFQVLFKDAGATFAKPLSISASNGLLFTFVGP